MLPVCPRRRCSRGRRVGRKAARCWPIVRRSSVATPRSRGPPSPWPSPVEETAVTTIRLDAIAIVPCRARGWDVLRSRPDRTTSSCGTSSWLPGASLTGTAVDRMWPRDRDAAGARLLHARRHDRRARRQRCIFAASAATRTNASEQPAVVVIAAIGAPLEIGQDVDATRCRRPPGRPRRTPARRPRHRAAGRHRRRRTHR